MIPNTEPPRWRIWELPCGRLTSKRSTQCKSLYIYIYIYTCNISTFVIDMFITCVPPKSWSWWPLFEKSKAFGSIRRASCETISWKPWKTPGTSNVQISLQNSMEKKHSLYHGIMNSNTKKIDMIGGQNTHEDAVHAAIFTWFPISRSCCLLV